MIRLVVFLLSLVFFSEAQDVTLSTAKWSDASQLVYSYDTETHITDNLGSLTPSSSVKLSMLVSITNVANVEKQGHLLQLAITEPRTGQGDQQKNLEGPMPLKSAFIVWRLGTIERLYVAKKEPTFWTNIYRGLASLIQSKAARGDYQDVDASGDCKVQYRQVEHNLIERVKRRCSSMDLSDEVNSRGEGRKVGKSRTGRTVLRLRASDNILESAEGKDTVAITVPVAGQVGPAAMAIESSQYLKLLKVESHEAGAGGEEDTEKAIERLEGAGAMRLTTLASDDEIKPKVTTQQLRKVIQQNQAVLTGEDGPKSESVTAFKTLLTALRGVRDARIILKILDDEELVDVAPTVLDAAVICATGPCMNVVFKRLRLKDSENLEEQERLLAGLSHMVDPDEATLTYLLEEAKKLPPLEAKDEPDGVRAQLWATIGALIGKHRLSPTGKYSKVTKDTVDFLQNHLNGEEVNEDTILAILTAIQNVGEAPETAHVILGYLVNSNVSHRVHCAAIDTMMTVGISDQVRGLARSRALRLVQSRPFQVDITARIRALDFLLSLHPTIAQVKAAAKALKVSSHLRDGFISRFKSWCRRENREDLWDLVMQHFPDMIQYPTASQPPQTYVSTFLSGNSSKGEVSGESAVDLTTDVDGSVRRSDSSAQLKLADTSRLPLYRLVLFTDGLNTASGSESETAGDVTAGIGLSILGVSIRPVRLFSGYGGLMSAIWNAPTSSTPFLQINLAFIDAQHIIHLQNGFSVRFVASGLAAIDLSGMVSISLWNQKADSKMKTTAAIGLSVNAELISSRMSARLTKNGSATFAMNFDANAEFSSLPPKICFVASFPDTEMIWRVQKSFGKDKESEKGRRLIPGSTLSLGRSNEQSCGSLLKD